MDVVTGRLWRTLRAVGSVVKTIIPGEGGGQRRLLTNGENGAGSNGNGHLVARRNTHLTIDEPNPDESRAAARQDHRAWLGGGRRRCGHHSD